MTKDDFIKKCYEIKNSWLDAEFEAYILAALDRGAVNLDRVPDNYGAVYPLLGAIFEDVARQCIYGGSNGAAVRRAVNKIKPKLHARGMYYNREI